jgi:hypothetical protein
MAKLKRPPIPISIVAFWLTILAAIVFAADRAWERVVDLRKLQAGKLHEASPSERRTLLLIRDDLAKGEVRSAHHRKATLQGRWIPGGLSQEILRELDLADLGVAEHAAALRFLSEGKIGLAYAAITKARQHYPRSVKIQNQYLQIAGDYAFSRREFDDYILAHSILGEAEPDDPHVVMLHAAAVAAQWALRNDNQAKEKAEELLAKAKKLGLAADLERFVRHRIDTRQLVTLREFK